MPRPRPLTRRQLQRALGVLWLLDAALQLQSFMFSTGFARQILAPAGDGQPGWVASPVHLFAAHLGQHPVLFNAAAALIQLALGVGFLVPRTVPAAVAASIGWSSAVWYLGEGLGGLASGHASLLTGAPGAAALYGVLAAASWPPRRPGVDEAGERPANWLPWAWATLWLGGAVLQLLTYDNRPAATGATIRDGADGAPGWLAAVDRDAASAVAHAGTTGFTVLIMLMAGVGIGALIPGRARTTAAYVGAGLAALFWVVGQNLGMVYSGQATDPNSGVLLILFAAATAAVAPRVALGATLAADSAVHDRPVPSHRPRPGISHVPPLRAHPKEFTHDHFDPPSTPARHDGAHRLSGRGRMQFLTHGRTQPTRPLDGNDLDRESRIDAVAGRGNDHHDQELQVHRFGHRRQWIHGAGDQ